MGGRHVNHFWRLLSTLQIPYLTLLDLDVSRYNAGWGRIKYVNDQLRKIDPQNSLPTDWKISKWNDDETPIRTHHVFGDRMTDVFDTLEDKGIFFSSPLDLDFAMLLAYPNAYGVVREKPVNSTIKAVLGRSHHDASQYSDDEQEFFGTYHHSFKLGSKPAAHIESLANLRDVELLANMPGSLGRLADAVIAKLEELPE